MDQSSIVIRQVESVQATAAKGGARPVAAHTLITGDYEGRGFRVAFYESTGTYGALVRGAEIETLKEMPEANDMASALRGYYRVVQNGQIADLTNKNRADMVADMQRRGVQAFVPRMNTHGVDSQLTRMEAEVARELQQAEGDGDEGDDDDAAAAATATSKGKKKK